MDMAGRLGHAHGTAKHSWATPFLHSQPRSPPSLLSLAETSFKSEVTRFLECPDRTFHAYAPRLRRYLRHTLPADLMTRLLAAFVPNEDKWTYPCLNVRERMACRRHPECQLVYHKCDKILQLLFTHTVTSLTLDLRKISRASHHAVLKQILHVLKQYQCPQLVRLKLTGGTAHTDHLLEQVERLCSLLVLHAPALKELHLPVCSNVAIRALSDLPRLHTLQTDRCRDFNRRGLWHLSHAKASTKANLQSLHFGAFKQRKFDKLDASKFLLKMRNMKSLSFLDEDRQRVSVGRMRRDKSKVLTYSVVKMAMNSAEATDRWRRRDRGTSSSPPPSPPRPSLHVADDDRDADAGPFRCGLRELKVVDKKLTPRYLLDACPDLERLYIDWQQELSFPQYNRFKPDWFSRMLRCPDWGKVCANLSVLDVVFPAAYSPNSYSLSLSDLTCFFENTNNLQRLRLVGASKVTPIPLTHLLRQCPRLQVLELDRTSMSVPGDLYHVPDPQCVSRNLVVFKFLGDIPSLAFNQLFTRAVALYLPELRELEIQPPGLLGYAGVTFAQLRELSQLSHLEKLSIQLSVRDSLMNLPAAAYVLREFVALKNLVLSWGQLHPSYDISRKRVSSGHAWLKNFLDCLGANFDVQAHPMMN